MQINVLCDEISEDEKQYYADYIRNKYPDRKISAISIIVDGEYVNIKTQFEDNKPFDRIRRITGYLVGTLDRFNDGKRAEEHDRVKHSVEDVEV